MHSRPVAEARVQGHGAAGRRGTATPAIRNGFYAVAVRGVFTSSGLTRWVYVDPVIIYTGTGTTITAAIPRA
jgi:hypothetical protein